MEPVAYLEVLDRHGRVAARHRLSHLPLYIGRAYTNDVILDDPYVSPAHARLVDEGGVPVLVDAGSDNGIIASGHRRVGSLRLETGARFRLGRTELRFCTAEQRVAPARLEERGALSPLSLTATTGRTILVGGGALLAVSLQQYFSSYERQTWADPISAALGVGFFVALWAGGWAVANRIVAQHSRFWTHFTWAAVLLVAFLLVDTAFQYLDFVTGWGDVHGVAGVVASVALGALLISGHLRVIGHIGRRRRVITAVAVATAITLLVTAIDEMEGDGDFSSALPGAGPLKPVAGRLLVSERLDEFVDRTAGLKDALDELTD